MYVLEPIRRDVSKPRNDPWLPSARISFRWCLIYFSLYCLGTQIAQSLVPFVGAEMPSTIGPVRELIFWTAESVFGAQLPLVYRATGSGDTTFNWVFVFVIFIAATAGTIIWSVLDRRRERYDKLYAWFRLVIRFMLAGQLIAYGVDKAIPLQMPLPSLERLVQPYGTFSPMGVLWSSIGSSPAYEIFAGCTELLAGILLIAPRTTRLGAFIGLIVMTHVFVLNMTYDVPVKLLSFHLLLLCVFLLAPDFTRFVNFFVLQHSTVERANGFALFRSQRANQIAFGFQVLAGFTLVGINVYAAVGGWFIYGQGSPKSPLYGIWNVEQAATTTEGDRPRRVIFDAAKSGSFQWDDDTLDRFQAAIDLKQRTIVLSKFSNDGPTQRFTFERHGDSQLTLIGAAGRWTRLDLQRVDLHSFRLNQSGFHWIQEYPYNR